MKIAVLALALLCLVLPANAMDCNDVKAVVKMVGKAKALQMARKAGASEDQINTARECLRSK